MQVVLLEFSVASEATIGYKSMNPGHVIREPFDVYTSLFYKFYKLLESSPSMCRPRSRYGYKPIHNCNHGALDDT